jgi:hypothetical protein
VTTQTTRTPGNFGEVLERLMRAHSLEPDPREIRQLAERSGLDGDALLCSMVAEQAEWLGYLDGLARESELAREEKGTIGRRATGRGGAGPPSRP